MCEITLEQFFGVKSLKTLNAELDKANGKARERTLDAGLCAQNLSDYEGYLDLPKTKLKGLKVRVHASMEKFPSAYKYTPYSTQAVFEHNGRRWVYVPGSSERDYVHQRTYGGHIQCIVMPDDTRDAIIAKKLFY